MRTGIRAIAAVACVCWSSMAYAQTRTWTGAVSSVFTTGSNWSGNTAPATGNTAQFNGTAGGNLSLTFGAAVGGANGILLDITSGQTGSLVINNSNAAAQTFRLLTGTSNIAAGAGAFTLGASGTANPITLALGSGTVLQQYYLQNNSANTATIGQNVNVVRGGTLDQRDLIFSGTGAWSVQGSVGNVTTSNTTVAIFVNGATVTLSGSNAHTLGTTVNSGVLNISGVGTLGATTNALTVASGLLDLGATSQTVGAATLTGGTISNGTLTASSFGAQAGTVSAILAGAGGLTKTTSGTITLTGSNTISGAVAVNEGVLVLAGGTNRLPVAAAVTLGTGSTAGKIVLGNASARSNQTLAGLTASGLGGSVVGGNATVSVLTLSPASGTVAFGGAIGGAGTNENAISLTKDGAGVVALTGSNTFTGGVDITRGTIEIGNDAALGGGTLTFVLSANAKRVRSTGTASRTIANTVSVGDDARLGGAGTGTLIFTGSWNGGSNAKLLTVDSDVELRGNINKTSTALTKDGAGTLLISGTASSFASTLAVTAGTLKVSGVLGTGTAATVSIGSGALLAGSGRINGALTGNGQIAPGNSPGILTADSLLATASTSFAFELTGTGAPAWGSATSSINDVLRLTNASSPFGSTLASTNAVNIYFGDTTGTFLGGFFTDNSVDFLSSVSSATYSYFIPGSGPGSISYNGTDYVSVANGNVALSTVAVASAGFIGGTVTNGYVTQFVVVPEPSACLTAVVGAALAMGLARRRR